MRHCTITLTMDTYGHLFPGQEAATVAALDSLTGAGPQAHAATGTDNARPIEAAGTERQQEQRQEQRQKQQTGVDSMRTGATLGEGAAPTARTICAEQRQPKTLSIAKLDEVVRTDAMQFESGRGGDRTRTSLTGNGILSPVRLPIPPLGRLIALAHCSVLVCRWANRPRQRTLPS